jgi:pseudaminic acid cytidylyltransferase
MSPDKEQLKALAVIPARGGSKRIPRKNIRPFIDKPIISYSIRAALEADLFDEVMVSTDDLEIADIAKMYGAQIPFLRSADTSDDYSTISDVLGEVLERYGSLGKRFENICVVYPAAPFVTAERIKQGFDLLCGGHHDAVFYVVRFSYPVQRALTINGGRLSFIHPENARKRSQDLGATYHDAGQLFWISRQAFLRERSVFVENIGAVELPEREVQDIDTLEDWELAELKYRSLSARKLSADLGSKK